MGYGARLGGATIDEVTERLAAVLDVCRARRSRAGYVAALFHEITRAIACDLAGGVFDDEDRMRRFAGVATRRYLDALATFERDEELTRSWCLAFLAAGRDDAVIVQHLLLGLNAHLNVDLAVAAAQVSRGGSIADLEADFGRLVDIVVNVAGRAQEAIAPFSPLLPLLGRVADRPGEELLRFSFPVAADEAWRRAQLLAALPVGRWPTMIDSLDRAAAVVARSVAQPGGILGKTVEVVRHAELEEVGAVIEALASVGSRP